jgi:hypothetical protein
LNILLSLEAVVLDVLELAQEQVLVVALVVC